MSTLREAAQQALEALIARGKRGDGSPDTVAALRAALAQQEQEAVVWGVDWGSHGDRSCCAIIKQHTDGTREVVAVEYAPSYTHPPRREWQLLSEEEIEDMSLSGTDSELRRRQFARAIEVKLKEKNQ